MCHIHAIFPVEFISIHAHALLTYVANFTGVCVCVCVCVCVLELETLKPFQLSLRDLSF